MTDIVTVGAFVAFAATCMPHGYNTQRLADYAMAESGTTISGVPYIDMHALNVNGIGEQHPGSIREAVDIAAAAIRSGRTADLGPMQLNSAHIGEPGMPSTLAMAYEPCVNIRSGAKVLDTATQAAIEYATSCGYNAGKPTCPPRYPAQVQAARRIVAHALQGAETTTQTTPPPEKPPAPPPEDADVDALWFHPQVNSVFAYQTQR